MMGILAAIVMSTGSVQAQSSAKWSGYYIGAHGGYQWSDIDITFDHSLLGLGDGATLDTDGWMGGAHAGFQQQFGKYVLGVEVTGSWGGADGSAEASFDVGSITCGRIGCFGAAANGTDKVSASLDSLYTLVGRFGYTFDNVLLYVKGGLAAGQISTHGSLTGDVEVCLFRCGSFDYSAVGSTKKKHYGWTIGAGAQLMISSNVSFGLDYGYINLGSETHQGTLSGNIGGLGHGPLIDIDADITNKVDPGAIHNVNARITFHFN
jgi:outer membrane immunogenic protein